MDFTVIDFETANSKRASACSLGIVKVKNGKITEKNSWLIKPNEMEFDYRNISIHGIRPEDVENEPEFDVLYETVFKKYLCNQLIVAHNASFDISVLRKTLDLYNIEYPSFDYLCTVKIAQKTWPELFNHKLNTVSDYLNFKFNHHDALEDCLACSNLLINACKRKNVDSPYVLADKLGISVGNVFQKGYNSCSINKRSSKKKII